MCFTLHKKYFSTIVRRENIEYSHYNEYYVVIDKKR